MMSYLWILLLSGLLASSAKAQDDVDTAVEAVGDPETPVDDAEPEVNAEETPAEPAADDAEADSAADDVEADSAADDVEADPAADDAEADPVADDAEADPVADDAEADPVADDAEADSAADDVKADPVVDDPQPDPDSATEPSPVVDDPEPDPDSATEPSPVVDDPEPDPDSATEPSPVVDDPEPDPDSTPEPSSVVDDPQPDPDSATEPSPAVDDPKPDPDSATEPSPVVDDPEPDPDSTPEPSPVVDDPQPEPGSVTEPSSVDEEDTQPAEKAIKGLEVEIIGSHNPVQNAPYDEPTPETDLEGGPADFTTININNELDKIIPNVRQGSRSYIPSDGEDALSNSDTDSKISQHEGQTAGSQGGDQPQARGASSTTLAGILCAIGVAAVGAVAGYFTYQRKQLCFKTGPEADPEAGRKADAAEAQSDPQVLNTLLKSDQQ
ncbi:cell surface glycoprotein 1 isoform X3 [Betta splendens]|uniref:Cell surface glycoprotein 1 isoform X3 n=1 Tax=Betta splendens TaxID=158456 RepID=A0A9W2XG38_BETSP|nr:cell surface glycoprotein 1 isoform X3 [Betta splendens]